MLQPFDFEPGWIPCRTGWVGLGILIKRIEGGWPFGASGDPVNDEAN